MQEEPDVSNETLFAQLFVDYDLGREIKKYNTFTVTYNLPDISNMKKDQLVDLVFRLQQQHDTEYSCSYNELKETDKSVLVRMIHEIVNKDLNDWYLSMSMAKEKVPQERKRALQPMFESLYKLIRNKPYEKGAK